MNLKVGEAQEKADSGFWQEQRLTDSLQSKHLHSKRKDGGATP